MRTRYGSHRILVRRLIPDMSSIFFYGLYMDTDLLREMNLNPAAVAQAKLLGYQIHIGNRASLTPKAGSTSYGMLIELPDDDVSTLYSAPDVSDYRPESVNAIRLNDGAVQSALCYNLPPDKLGAGFNSEYAKSLFALLIKLGFPITYANEINKRGDA